MFFKHNCRIVVNLKGEMHESASTRVMGKDCADIWHGLQLMVIQIWAEVLDCEFVIVGTFKNRPLVVIIWCLARFILTISVWFQLLMMVHAAPAVHASTVNVLYRGVKLFISFIVLCSIVYFLYRKIQIMVSACLPLLLTTLYDKK